MDENTKNSYDPFLRLVIRHASLVRFLFTGGVNTLFDLLLYAIFANFYSISPVVASLLSTGITLILSFFLNKYFVFKSQRKYKDTAIFFIMITLINVWVVQSAVLYLFLQIMHGIPYFIAHQWTENMIAKLCGVSVSMVLNYLGYKKIFKEAE